MRESVPLVCHVNCSANLSMESSVVIEDQAKVEGLVLNVVVAMCQDDIINGGPGEREVISALSLDWVENGQVGVTRFAPTASLAFHEVG